MIIPYRKLIKPRLGSRPYKGHRLSKGLVGLWLMNENGGTTVFDLSGNGNTGAFGAGAASPSWVPGKFGLALSFDGGDYVDVGTNASLDVTKLTWVIWIKRAETTHTDERVLISYDGGGDNTNGVYSLQIDATGNQDKLQFLVHGGDSVVSNTAIQDTNWHQIAVTRRGDDTVNFYLDGSPNGSGSVGAKSAFNSVVIGKGHTTYSPFYGLIDHVKIWNLALSASEIALDYREPFAMFKDPVEFALLGGFTPIVGAAGIMTTNPGIWGPTF